MSRRREVSRIEGFSDAVFAFAITLLVVSLEVPKTFDELAAVIRGFPVFAICFALLFQVWWRHYKFFRDYDLEDSTTIALTGLLLFVVLFYVYPLKFLWSAVFSQLGGRPVPADMIRADQFPTVTASGSITNERLSRNGNFPLPPGVKQQYTFGTVGLNLLSYEVDAWGRLRRASGWRCILGPLSGSCSACPSLPG